MFKLLNINGINRVITTLLFGVIMFFPLDVRATHIVGGEITYKYIDKDTFLVTLTLRRDCFLGSEEAQFDDPASIGVYTTAGDLVTWLPGLTMGQLLLPFMESDTLNQFIRSDCGFEGTQVCVHETKYQGKVRLPRRVGQGGYVLAYQRCCRNGSLNNVINPLETGTTYWISIDENIFGSQKNSSPEFVDWPDVYICANEPFEFNHSAFDLDGDSLAYKLVVPHSGGSITRPRPQPPSIPPYPVIEFASPYSLSDVMGGVPLTIDPVTGIMTATPNLVGQFLVGVAVEEYRNGVLIDVVRRDFQFNVRVCTQAPLADFTTSETNCDGLTVEFYNHSLASNDFRWNFNYPDGGSEFMSQEANPIFTFPEAGVYNVTLFAVRGSDLCADSITKQVAVFENKISADFSYTLNGCYDDKDSLEIVLSDASDFNQPGYSLSEWKWVFIQNGVETQLSGETVTIKVSTTENYEIKMHVVAENGCEADISKIIDPQTLIPKNDFDVILEGCIQDQVVQIKLLDISQGLNPYGIVENSQWDVDGQIYTGNPKNILLPYDGVGIHIKLKTTFKEGCDVEISKFIDVGDLVPKLNASLNVPNCPDENSILIQLNYLDNLSHGLEPGVIKWSAGISSSLNDYTGSTIEFVIPKDSVLHYSLETVFENGCFDKLVVDTLPGPFASLKFSSVPIVLCPNDTISILTNANPDWLYQWSPLEGLDLSDPSDPRVFSNENRTYYITVTDGICTVSDSIDVTVLVGGIDLTIDGDSVVCQNIVSLSVSGGVGEGVYNWTNGPNSGVIIGVGDSVILPLTRREETFYVRFVGEMCSTQPATFTVRNETPLIENTSPVRICNSDTLDLTTVSLVGYHENIFMWQNDSHIISGQNTPHPIIAIDETETGSFTLYYTVENQFGCVLNDSVQVKIDIPPIVDFTFDVVECGSLEICFEVIGDYRAFLNWDFGDPTTEDDTSIDKSPCYNYNDVGQYTVVLSNIARVCEFEPVVKEVSVNAGIDLSYIGNRQVCLDDTLTHTLSSSVDNLDYVWTDVNGNILSQDTFYTFVATDDQKIIIKATDQYGCFEVDTISINVVRFDYSFDFGKNDTLCNNQVNDIKLLIDNPSDYEIVWSPEEIVVSGQNTATPSILTGFADEISVTLTHKLTGCTDTRSFKPDLFDTFDFTVDVPEIVCYDLSTTLSVNIDNPDNYTYHWEPEGLFISGFNSPNPSLLIDKDTSAVITVVDKITGCVVVKTVPLLVGFSLFVDVEVEPDSEIYEGGSVDLSVVDILDDSEYIWNTGESGTTITVSPEETTVYVVTVTDQNGCTATGSVEVVVRNAKCDETDVYLPNAFTPNGDGVNDVFIPRSNFIDEMQLVIYNRWGQEVFTSIDKNQGWDGTYEGKLLPADSFAYYLKVRCVNAEEYIKKGNVTLIR